MAPNNDGVVLYVCPDLADWLELTLDADFASCLAPESDLDTGDVERSPVGAAAAQEQSERSEQHEDSRDESDEECGIDDEDPDSLEASVDLKDDLDALRQSLDLVTVDPPSDVQPEHGSPAPEPLVFVWTALEASALN